MKNDLIPYLQERKERINNFLLKFLAEQPNKNNRVYEAISYSLLNGGKRLRPILVYAAGETFGAKLNSLDIPAAAVEFIHCFSLIHDDLPAMDNDDFRRNLPTCHKKFDEATAILAGDALAMLPFSLLSNNYLTALNSDTKLQLINILTKSSLQMVIGQAIDMDASLALTNKNNINLAQLENMYELKTGALIRASIKLGVITAAITDEDILKNLDEFARCIGLAFQIQDDIFDVTNKDAKQQDKIIYPTLVGIEQSKTKVEELFSKGISTLNNINADTSRLKSLAYYIMQRDY